MEPFLDPHLTIHELTSLNVIKPFLQCMLHCNHFLHWIVQLVLEHVYRDQLVHLDKNNICSCTSSSVWTILPTRIRKIHQMVLGLKIGLSQEISRWCIIQISILFQAQIFIVSNVSQQMYQSLKVYLTRIC